MKFSHGAEKELNGADNMRHGAKNVQHGAKNVRPGAKSDQHGAKKKIALCQILCDRSIKKHEYRYRLLATYG